MILQREILAKNAALEDKIEFLERTLRELQDEREKEASRLSEEVQRLRTETEVCRNYNCRPNSRIYIYPVFVCVCQVLSQTMETLRASRVTIDDQPIRVSVLREENEKLRNRVELQEKELVKSKMFKDMVDQQVQLNLTKCCINCFYVILFLLSFLLQILALQEKNRECERRLEESQQQLDVLRRETQQMKSEAMLKTSQVRG